MLLLLCVFVSRGETLAQLGMVHGGRETSRVFSPGVPHFKCGEVNKNIMEAGCFLELFWIVCSTEKYPTSLPSVEQNKILSLGYLKKNEFPV